MDSGKPLDIDLYGATAMGSWADDFDEDEFLSNCPVVPQSVVAPAPIVPQRVVAPALPSKQRRTRGHENEAFLATRCRVPQQQEAPRDITDMITKLCEVIVPLDARSIGLTAYSCVKQKGLRIQNIGRNSRELMAFGLQYKLISLFQGNGILPKDWMPYIVQIVKAFDKRIWGDKSYIEAPCVDMESYILNMRDLERLRINNEKAYKKAENVTEMPDMYVRLISRDIVPLV